MIAVLPPEVVNQIAAGEVIERPFSVVKELVENSLDAGATRIHVEVQDGGHTLVRVHDDGCGFTEDDLRLAFTSHATSKLARAEDLDHIASLGFRGEALASIGSVSRARIKSRVADQSSGYEVDSAGGEVRPCGCPPGTQLEVRDLFYNTPARRRFLRTPQAEKARIQDMIVRLALARLDVDFTFTSDGNQVLRLPASESLADRAARAFGRRLRGSLIEVSRGSGEYMVEGLLGDPDAARRDSTLELLYVNGRCARDRSATYAVRQAYKAFLMHGRYPVYFLMLSMPPADVDVNVHPTKAELRFRHGRRVSGLLHDAVAAGLQGRGHAAGGGALSVGEDKPVARSGFPDLPTDLFGRAAAPAQNAGTTPRGFAAGERRVDSPPAASGAAPTTAAENERPHPFRDLHPRRFLQILDLYLVLEGPEGMVVVDQHALHERVVYEKLKRRDRDRAATVQRLLVPEVLELTAVDKAYLLESREALAEEGFLLEDFGGNSVAVQGAPTVLGKARPAALVEAFLLGDGEGDARPRARDAVLERFHSMACRGSVMSGDRLTEEEIEALLTDAASLEHPHNCPHGRPTVLTFGRGELERFFRRRV